MKSEIQIKNSAGVCRIELKVLSNNENALRLYEKLSFKERKKCMAMDLT